MSLLQETLKNRAMAAERASRSPEGGEDPAISPLDDRHAASAFMPGAAATAGNASDGAARSRLHPPTLPAEGAPTWQDYFEERTVWSPPSSDHDASQTRMVLYSSGAAAPPGWTPPAGATTSGKPLVLLVHGAGHCALTFADLARHLSHHVAHMAAPASAAAAPAPAGAAPADAAAAAAAGVPPANPTAAPRWPWHLVAYDGRGHGETQTDNDADLSLDRLARDAETLVADMVEQHRAGHAGLPPKDIVLVGHSLGGAVVVEAAGRLARRTPPVRVLGVAVLDVVEGTAMASLDHMQQILTQRPAGFRTEAEALRWMTSSHLLGGSRNARLQRLMLPAQLKPHPETGLLQWTSDLPRSSTYWAGWFTGLSAKFLQLGCAKLLVLAGTDRLDKELMIGQMQGKFQMVIYPDSGHNIQEDVPDHLAEDLVAFWQRNQPLDLRAIRKVSLPASKPAAPSASS